MPRSDDQSLGVVRRSRSFRQRDLPHRAPAALAEQGPEAVEPVVFKPNWDRAGLRAGAEAAMARSTSLMRISMVAPKSNVPGSTASGNRCIVATGDFQQAV